MPIQPSSEVVLSMIQPVSSSYEAVHPSISFSSFTKYDSTSIHSLENNQVLFLVYPDNFNGLQFTIIRAFCNITGNQNDILANGIHYSKTTTFVKTPAYDFGFILKDSVDSNQHSLFVPWTAIKNSYCEVGFLINPNYVKLDGITF